MEYQGLQVFLIPSVVSEHMTIKNHEIDINGTKTVVPKNTLLPSEYIFSAEAFRLEENNSIHLDYC